MATLVSFHAHPDDEAIACGGTIARAAAEGHRVVIVFATKGERGEVPEGFLNPGELLWQRRVEESHAAAKLLGAHRVVFLGYTDSGMMGEPTNDDPDCFWQADVDDAARRLGAVLVEEEADVLTVYDDNGGYGHPDHIQVHRVGVRASDQVRLGAVYEATFSREYFRDLMRGWGEERPEDVPEDPDAVGVADALITTRVDVRRYLAHKRQAMAAHASQVADTSFFLAQPPERFEALWGTEWFIRRGAPQSSIQHWLFEVET